MSDAFNVEEFYSGLTESVVVQNDPSDRSDRINKITMSAPVNYGKIFFVPFLPKKGKVTPWIYLNKPNKEVDERTRELKIYNEDFDAEVWHRVLPKTYYGELSLENSELYDRVVSKFDYASDEELFEYDKQKRGSYALIYAYVLSHFGLDNTPVKDFKPSASLIVFPSASMAGKVKDNIDAVTLSSGNSKGWIPMVYNNEVANRQGFVQVSFNRGASAYDVSVTHGMNTPMQPVVPADLVISADEFNLFQDAIQDFLGWQGTDSGLFNPEVFKAMDEMLTKAINEYEGVVVNNGAQIPPVVNQNAPIDPMLPPVTAVPPVAQFTPPPVESAPGQIDPLAHVAPPVDTQFTPPPVTPPTA